MNVDEIVKERLEERIGSVVQDYRSGNLRAEVEAELKRKQLKEKICHVFKWENISGFNYNLYTLGLALTKNKTYYNSLWKMGNSYYISESKRAARFLLRVIFFILMVASYVYGWSLLEELKVAYTNPNSGFSSFYPFSLIMAYVFLGVVPFVISLDHVITVSKKPLYIVIMVLTFAWLMYIVFFFFPALFPQWEISWGDIGMSVIIGCCFSLSVTFLCLWICYAIYS